MKFQAEQATEGENMAFSDLGKLLEIVEYVVRVMEKNTGLEVNVRSDDINYLNNKIAGLKQKEGFK